MKRQGYVALAFVLLCAACARQAPERQAVDDAAAALGGDRLLAVRTVVIEGEGTQYNLGQDVVPDTRGQTFAITQYKRAVDLSAERARTELTRTPKFTYWQGLAPQRQIQGIDKAIGYNVAPSGAASRIGQAAADDRRGELLRHPITAVRAALDPAARVTNSRTEGGQLMVDVLTSDGRAFTLAIDSATKLPTRVITAANNVNLGDVLISTEFTEYQNVSGLQLPARLTTKTDDFTTTELRVTRQAVDTDTGDLAAPSAVVSVNVPAPAPPNVTVEEVSRGICCWRADRITARSWSSRII